MISTYTYTRTFAPMSAWASTLPQTCDRPDHEHSGVRPGEMCAVESCGNLIRRDEEVYYVTDRSADDAGEVIHPRTDGSDPAVCWRHVYADRGPIIVTTTI